MADDKLSLTDSVFRCHISCVLSYISKSSAGDIFKSKSHDELLLIMDSLFCQGQLRYASGFNNLSHL